MKGHHDHDSQNLNCSTIQKKQYSDQDFIMVNANALKSVLKLQLKLSRICNMVAIVMKADLLQVNI